MRLPLAAAAAAAAAAVLLVVHRVPQERWKPQKQLARYRQWQGLEWREEERHESGHVSGSGSGSGQMPTMRKMRTKVRRGLGNRRPSFSCPPLFEEKRGWRWRQSTSPCCWCLVLVCCVGDVNAAGACGIQKKKPRQ